MFFYLEFYLKNKQNSINFFNDKINKILLNVKLGIAFFRYNQFRR
jgi:hypothetical protein